MERSLKPILVGFAVVSLLWGCFCVRATIKEYEAESLLMAQLCGGKPYVCIPDSNEEWVVDFTDPGMSVVYPCKPGLRWCVLRLFTNETPRSYPCLTIDTDHTFNTVVDDAKGVPHILRRPIESFGSFEALQSLKSVTVRGTITSDILRHLATAPRINELVLAGQLGDSVESVCDSIVSCPGVNTVDLRDLEGDRGRLARALRRRQIVVQEVSREE